MPSATLTMVHGQAVFFSGHKTPIRLLSYPYFHTIRGSKVSPIRGEELLPNRPIHLVNAGMGSLSIWWCKEHMVAIINITIGEKLTIRRICNCLAILELIPNHLTIRKPPKK